MLNEYCAVAVSSEAKDGEALDGFIDGRTAIAQYGKCTCLMPLAVFSNIKTKLIELP